MRAAKLACELQHNEGWKLQVVKRRERAFKDHRADAVVERSFAWLGRNRRSAKITNIRADS